MGRTGKAFPFLVERSYFIAVKQLGWPNGGSCLWGHLVWKTYIGFQLHIVVLWVGISHHRGSAGS